MHIWLITVGEPWPTDGDNPRLHRTGINAGFLAARGHDVVSWSGTFDHFTKTERTGHDLEFSAPQNYPIVGLYAGTYNRNVSIKRIRYHREVARRFRAEAARRSAPEIIVVSLTPLELARAAVEYGREKNIPVIVDVRDLWPDAWADQLPAPLRPFRHILLKPFYDDLKHAVRGATAIIGITDAMVDWAMTSTGRARGALDRAFPLVYLTQQPDAAAIAAARKHWLSEGVGASPDEIVGCFFGNVSHRAEFETPFRAIAEMPDALRSRIKLVMCGRGENEALVRDYAARVPQIHFHGWADAPHIRALMEISHFGLLPYPPDFDFMMSLPNKVFEYLSGGLPIITSLPGETEKLFARYGCGKTYTSGQPKTFEAILQGFVSNPGELAALTAGARAAGSAYDATAISVSFETYLENVLRR